jgi:hypothetical protein
MKTDHVACACAPARGQAVALQNIADRLIGNYVPEIAQSARNPVIAPARILARHTNNQLLRLPLDWNVQRRCLGFH